MSKVCWSSATKILKPFSISNGKSNKFCTFSFAILFNSVISGIFSSIESLFLFNERNELVDVAKVKNFYPDYGHVGIVSYYYLFLFGSVTKFIDLKVRLSYDDYLFYI